MNGNDNAKKMFIKGVLPSKYRIDMFYKEIQTSMVYYLCHYLNVNTQDDKRKFK